MGDTNNFILLYFFFWLAYRVYSLKEDYTNIREYIFDEYENDEEESDSREDAFEVTRNSGLRMLPDTVTRVLAAIITIIGLIFYSIDIVGLVIAIMQFSFPKYIYWSLLILIGVLVVRLIIRSIQIPTYFMLVVKTDASMEAIERFIAIKFFGDFGDLPPYILLIIHLICLAVAIYAVAQFV